MDEVKNFYEALSKDTLMREQVKRLEIAQSPDSKKAFAILAQFAAGKGYPFTADDAEAYFTGEISDEAMENVSGGENFGVMANCPLCQGMMSYSMTTGDGKCVKCGFFVKNNDSHVCPGCGGRLAKTLFGDTYCISCGYSKKGGMW
jgi:ribosomal protein L37AE/L43A